MNAPISFAPVSDPCQVMAMINGSKSNSNRPNAEKTQLDPNRVPAQSSFSPVRSTLLKLHVAPEEAETWSNSEPVPTQQVEQLIQHLRKRQRDLDQREADLQSSVYRIEQQEFSQQAQLRKRSAELDQQLTQVKLQQAQLIKLQQSMLETQTALRRVIEKIVDSCEHGELKLELQKLKFELNESLNAILTRWERIKFQVNETA